MTSMVESLEMMIQCIGHNILPYEDRYVFNSSSIFMWTRASNDDHEMSKFTLQSQFEFSISSTLATELQDIPGTTTVEIVSIKKNPFWWNRGLNNDVQSNLLNLNIRKINGSVDKLINKMKNPVDIYLDLSSIDQSTVSGKANRILHNYNEDEKDSAVSVHRVESPIGAKIFLQFVKIPQPLKVLVLLNKIPDYEFITELGSSITEESLNYEIKDISIAEDSFFYVGILPDMTYTNSNNLDYSFNVMTVNCKSWHNTFFTNKFCQVSQYSTAEKLHCLCHHMSTYGGAKLIAPELINPVDDLKLFLTLKDNPVVFSVVIAMLIGYVLLMIWARYKDKTAQKQHIVTILEDNFPQDKFGYLLTVYTGARIQSGTDANVGIKLIGTNKTSRTHILKSPIRNTLERNNDDWFLLFSPEYLGQLKNIHIWHDNDGGNADWFCEKIVVYDLKTKDEYVFLVEQWLASGENQYLEIFIPPVDKEKTRTMRKLAFENVSLGFRELHDWASIINRHPRSSNSRTHRLTLVMCIIMLSLLSSIMFYNVTGEEDESTFNIKVRDIIIALETIVVCLPGVFIINFLFKKSRVQEKKKDVDIIQPSGIFGRIFSKIKRSIFRTETLNPVKLFTTDQTPTAKKKKKWLISAWVFSQTVIITCAFFIILYGLKLGKVKSCLWLLATTLAIGNDVIFMGPLKVIAFAFIFAWFNKRMFQVETFELNIEDVKREQLVGNEEHLQKVVNLRSHPMYQPPTHSQILEFRAKHSDYRTLILFLENVVVLIFWILLLILVNDMATAKHYYKNQNIQKMLDYSVSADIISFHEIYNLNSFQQYVSYNFLPKVYWMFWYNNEIQSDLDKKFGFSGWFIDRSQRLIGIPRIRQIRVKKDACHVPKVIRNINNKTKCVASLKGRTEEIRNFKMSWDEEDLDEDPTPSPWVYGHSEDSKVASLYGLSRKRYHGGGYVYNLGRTMKESNYSLSELQVLEWMDFYSQALIVELILYNVNNNIFSIVDFIVENLPGGFVIIKLEVVSLQVTREWSAYIIIFAIFTVYFIIRIVYFLNKLGLEKYIFNFWNCFDIFVLTIIITNFALHLEHVFFSSYRIETFQKEGKDVFFNYKDLVIYYRYITLLLSLLIICCTIRLLRTYQFGRNVYIIFYTMSFFAITLGIWTIIFIFFLLLQSFITSYRLNAPFSNSLTMFFMDKTGYKHLLDESVFPTKKAVLFMYCISLVLLKVIALVLCCYYYRISRNYKVSKSNLVSYFTFIPNIIAKCFSSFKTKDDPRRLRGGMDNFTLDKSKEQDMILMAKFFLENLLKLNLLTEKKI
uniref:PLAT domain-containing protein n=1 Tax=Clastoptera arizonana TaxID=38151 RepID=A0A1B6DV80_9HEMI